MASSAQVFLQKKNKKQNKQKQDSFKGALCSFQR